MVEIEPGYFQVNSFEDVREYTQALFASRGVDTLYKLRYWRERYHPEFLRDGEIYFSKPNELNDPFDINRPLNIHIDEIKSQAFYKRLVETAPEVLGVKPGHEAEQAARAQQERLLSNPQEELLSNFHNLINDPQYNNSIGVLSLSTKIDDEQLWGYYGGALRGYAVGFDPMKLSEELFSYCNYVNYTDTVPVTKLINKSRKEMQDAWFDKNQCWGFESEFRYVRAVFDETRRKHNYAPDTVKEIVLGPRIVSEDRAAIIDLARRRYPNAAVLQMNVDYIKGKMVPERIR
ncbi:MAG: DUF2971 domain-containing protein [Flavipsychrobacter sp.]|nr:DUF2971 domain-containing protein [Flavipsychrobacter sp.]